MTAHALPARAATSLHAPPSQPQSYCPIPQRLITDLHDTPLAIGLYALLARLYFVAQAPVPLSVPDVMRYDPTLSRGAAIRAFARLTAGGWLVETTRRGHKTRYIPTWGLIKGAALAWRMDQPCLGRPRHVARLMLDRALLDVCMGKLTPHPTQTAPITRYVTTPALSLADIGCYALTLAGLPRETPALRWLGLVRQSLACPLPGEQRLLAIISQRAFVMDDADAPQDVALTTAGTRRLGLTPAPHEHDGRAQPLFFVPPELIGSMIRPMIGSMIGQDEPHDVAPTALAGAKPRSDGRDDGITWESRDTWDVGIPPPSPPRTHDGGAGVRSAQHDQATGRSAEGPVKRAGETPAFVIPDTETVRLLRAINVLPEQLVELAELPAETVRSAIADGNARPGVRDLAGWVVKLLRTHRDYGWTISPPAPRADSPEALAATFARYAAEQAAEREAETLALAPDARPGVPESASTRDLARLWDEVLAVLRLQLPRQEFNTWVRPAALHAVEDGVATVIAPDARIKAAIERSYLAILRDLLARQLGAARVRIVLAGAERLADPAIQPAQTPTAGRPSDATAPGDAGTQDTGIADQQPDWICAERWRLLPAVLRAALLGSTLVDGAVQAKSPHLARLLETRYSREVQDLLVC